MRQEVLALLEFDSDQTHEVTGSNLSLAVKEVASLALSGDTASPPARRVGPFEIGRLLGSGGMGTVYEGRRIDGEVQQRVAVKFVNTAGTVSALRTGAEHRRFYRERQLLASLKHPYIAGLIDAGTTPDGQPYAIIEQVDGVPIDLWCESAGTGSEDRIYLVLKLCEAVQFAHGNLIVHSDIKPENVLVTDDGIPKLIDFGIGSNLADEASLTTTRGFTPGYASPEQAQGLPATVVTDVYGVGMVLYRLLTGASPRTLSGSSLDVIRRISEDDVVRPAAIRPELKGDLENILIKALQRDPQRRYGSIPDLAEDLRRYLGKRPVKASPDSVLYRLRRFVQRQWVPLTATVAVIAALTVSTVVLAFERQRALQRAADTRKLAGTLLLEVHDEIGGLASGSKARAKLGAIAVQYLEALERDYGRDPELAWELLNACSRLGQSLGGGSSSVGDSAAGLRMALRTLQLGSIVENKGLDDVRLDQLFIAYEGLAPIFQQASRPNEEREVVDRLLRLAPRLGPVREAEALIHLARYFDMHGTASESAAAVENALAIMRRLCADPGTPEKTKARLMSILVSVGRVQALSGNFGAAVASLEEAVRFSESTVAANPQKIVGVRQLYWSHIVLGDVYGSTARFSLGHTNDAVKHYQKARELAERLARADPDNEVATLDLARALTREAAVLTKDHPARAAELFEESHTAIAAREPLSPARLDALLTYLTSSVGVLVQLGDLDKAQLRLNEAYRIAARMRHEGVEVEDRALLRPKAILLYAAGQRREALEMAQMHLAQRPSRTDPVLAVNFDTLEVLERIRTYSAGIDQGACAAATARTVQIWNDLWLFHPSSRLIQSYRERALASAKWGCRSAPVLHARRQ